MANLPIRVVGGGPAGAATAIRLARHGFRVTLVEREGRAASHGGELLPPSIQPLLAELQVLERFLRGPHLPSFGNESAWGGGALRLRSCMTNAHGEGWHIDREAFEALLLDAARRAGVAFVSDDEAHEEAAFVVDASGRSAHVARALGVRRIHTDHLLAVLGVLEGRPSGPPAQTALVEAVEDGFWYSGPLPQGQLFCAYLTDPSLWATGDRAPLGAFRLRLQRTRHTAARTVDLATVAPLRVVPAGTSRLQAMVGQRWLAVGDAAAARDPLSSGGIYEALRSGLRAAEALARHFQGDAGALGAYARDMEDRFLKDLVRRHSMYLLEQRWPHAPFWARRHASQPVAAGPGLGATT